MWQGLSSSQGSSCQVMGEVPLDCVRCEWGVLVVYPYIYKPIMICYVLPNMFLWWLLYCCVTVCFAVYQRGKCWYVTLSIRAKQTVVFGLHARAPPCITHFNNINVHLERAIKYVVIIIYMLYWCLIIHFHAWMTPLGVWLQHWNLHTYTYIICMLIYVHVYTYIYLHIYSIITVSMYSNGCGCIYRFYPLYYHY